MLFFLIEFTIVVERWYNVANLITNLHYEKYKTKELRLIQAQTIEEAVEKFRVGLKQSKERKQSILQYDNKTII